MKKLSPFLEDILFAAPMRVYTFRVLLVASIVGFSLTLLTWPWPPALASGIDPGLVWVDCLTWYGLMTGTGLSIIHQTTTGLVLKPNLFLAILDMILLLIEIIVMIVGLVLSTSLSQEFERLFINIAPPIPQAWLIASLPVSVLVILGLSFSFTLRLAAIRRGQGFGLLGGSKPTALPYNRKSIFLNRSFQRPLVRGESMLIRLIRALCISGIMLLVPAFGIYAIILGPSKQQTYLQVQSDAWSDWDFNQMAPTGDGFLHNATFWIAPLVSFSAAAEFFYGVPVNLTVMVVNESGNPTTCVETNMNIAQLLTICEYGITLGGQIYFEISLPPGLLGVTVTPMPYSDIIGYTTSQTGRILADGSFTVLNFATPARPIIVLRDSYLVGQITWTREVGQSPSLGSIFVPSVISLQHDTTAVASTNSSHSAGLRIFNPVDPTGSSRIFYQQTNDRSIFSGISNLGGFWTFVDSTFALLFGANVIYFAFGHRPVSALGVLHIFQRKTLTRNWNEDFPALRTEGGIPGTDSAGIVAFIRERLVDLGKAPNPSTATQKLPLVEHQKTNEDACKV